MMELLKRFEEQSTQREKDSSDSGGEDDGDDLARRLQGVDLGKELFLDMVLYSWIGYRLCIYR